MKPIHILIAVLLATSSKSDSQINFPFLKGLNMGQKPPGMVAEPFAPSIISKKG